MHISIYKLFSHSTVDSSYDYRSVIIVEMSSCIMKVTQNMSKMIDGLHMPGDGGTSARQTDPPPPYACGALTIAPPPSWTL